MSENDELSALDPEYWRVPQELKGLAQEAGELFHLKRQQMINATPICEESGEIGQFVAFVFKKGDLRPQYQTKSGVKFFVPLEVSID